MAHRRGQRGRRRSRSRTRPPARSIRTVPVDAARRACARMVERAPRRAARLGGARLRGPRARSSAARRSGSPTTPSGSSRRSSPRPARRYEDALLAEVAYAANAFGFWAKHAPDYLADEKVRSANPFVLGRKLVVRYRPVGVVGVIGPWNYPLTNSFGDCIPALAAGNAVDPQAGRGDAADLAADGRGPARVRPARGRLPGRDRQRPETGAALIDARRHGHVHRLDARPAGRSWSAPRATLTPVSLELGGKDPMIVLADADLERAANAAVYYSMQNGGQTCISVERVYVEAPVYDEFVARGRPSKVGALRQGVPGGPGTVDVGAITFPPQIDIVAPPRRAGARRRARGAGRRPRARRRAGASTSRPCSSTSTTRWRR